MDQYSCTFGQNGQGPGILSPLDGELPSHYCRCAVDRTIRSDIRAKRAVKHRILNFDMTSLKGKYVTVKRAKVLCKDQTLAEIEAVSAGAAVFFSWCMVTIDAFEMLT